MSALTKPLNHFSAAINGTNNIAVAAEDVLIAVKKDEDTLQMGSGTKTTSYFIEIHWKKPNTDPTKIQFASSSARNTSWTNYLTANSAAIA